MVSRCSPLCSAERDALTENGYAMPCHLPYYAGSFKHHRSPWGKYGGIRRFFFVEERREERGRDSRELRRSTGHDKDGKESLSTPPCHEQTDHVSLTGQQVIRDTTGAVTSMFLFARADTSGITLVHPNKDSYVPYTDTKLQRRSSPQESRFENSPPL